jgi:hypothetical protein
MEIINISIDIGGLKSTYIYTNIDNLHIYVYTLYFSIYRREENNYLFIRWVRVVGMWCVLNGAGGARLYLVYSLCLLPSALSGAFMDLIFNFFICIKDFLLPSGLNGL